VRFSNLLTAKGLFGENQGIMKCHRLTDLSAYRPDCVCRPIGLLTKLGSKTQRDHP